MKKIFCLLTGFLLFVPALRAQTDVDLDTELGGRLSLSVDKKILKGLHVSLEEEVRMDDNFASFNRFHTTLGVSYKLHPNIKVGLGYAIINPYSTNNKAFKSSRHRLMADVIGSMQFGNWRLSLKERFQATYRSGDMNEYQAPRTALALKSRLKVTYKALRRWEPYASVELRNTFNAPVIVANYDGTDYLTESMSQHGEAGWFLDGFNGSYVNRLRGAVGVDYRLSKASSLDVSLMADYVMDKVVDANAAGTKLKSYTRETGVVGWLAVGYTYSF